MPQSIPYPVPHIDHHALAVPVSAEQSLRTLATYLVAPARNDYEKTRALFFWVTHNIAYSVDEYFGHAVGHISAEGVLKQRQAVCEGYSTLLEALGIEVGLEIVRVSGYAKGYSYSVGSPLLKADHMWNAVKLDRHWHLMDPTWAAGHIDNDQKFVYAFEEFYFLTLPKHFIYSHLPEDPRWQLLPSPVTKEEFEEWPRTRPAFFIQGLEIVSPLHGTVRTKSEVTVTITAPRDITLTARLERREAKLDESWTLVQPLAGNRWFVQALVPEPGEYILRTFGKRKGAKEFHDWVLDYRIVAREGNAQPFGYPLTYGTFHECAASVYAPRTRFLSMGRTYRFQVVVPGADKVFTVINDGPWSALRKDGYSFSGEVRTNYKGALNVYAKFYGAGDYNGILQYQII